MQLLLIECNGVMQVGRLHGFDGNIKAQGNLLLQVCWRMGNWPSLPFTFFTVQKMYLKRKKVPCTDTGKLPCLGEPSRPAV
jgi:hypothetical protein